MSRLKATVQITHGWNGETVLMSTTVVSVDLKGLYEKASDWIRNHTLGSVSPYWTMTALPEGPTIVDYGSHITFARFIPMDGVPPINTKAKRKTTMSKKKPYSKIESGKAIRAIKATAARNAKIYATDGAPDWYLRLNNELAVLTENTVKLRDFLYVKETKDAKVVLSAEANAVCSKALKLLVKQEKQMGDLCATLQARIDLGWPKDPAPCKVAAKKCGCKVGEKCKHDKALAKKAVAKKGE
jgi:hypothetical protein